MAAKNTTTFEYVSKMMSMTERVFTLKNVFSIKIVTFKDGFKRAKSALYAPKREAGYRARSLQQQGKSIRHRLVRLPIGTAIDMRHRAAGLPTDTLGRHRTMSQVLANKGNVRSVDMVIAITVSLEQVE